jgi:hypothetical protein
MFWCEPVIRDDCSGLRGQDECGNEGPVPVRGAEDVSAAVEIEDRGVVTQRECWDAT